MTETLIPESSIESFNFCLQAFLMPCSFQCQQAGKEKCIHQGCAPLLYQAVGLLPPMMSSCGTGRNPSKEVEQHFLVSFQYTVWEYSQPIQSSLSHPSMHFPGNNIYNQVENLGVSFFTIWQFSVPLKISIWGNFEPSAHTDTTIVALFVSFVEVWIFSDFVPFYCSVFFEWQVKNIEVWSMLTINFGLWFCSLTLGQISCIKSNAFAANSTGDLFVSWVPIWYFKDWLFSHIKITFTFALSDFPWNLQHNQMPCNIQYVTTQQSSVPITQRHAKEAHQ